MAQLRVVPGGLASPAVGTERSAEAQSDREVLARVVERDQAAHRVIFERYYKRVLAFVRRRLGDEGLAEEVTTDVFFEVWRNAAAYRGESPVTTWIFGIANLKALSARRYFAQPRRASVRVASDDSLSRFADPANQDESITARQELGRLVRAIERLPAGYRDVLRLAFLEGCSYPEIAERLDISEANVKTRVNRARSRLRTLTGLGMEE
ncbi:MAG TPA: RNA polymerase sigma factor [Myxococcota bacterium]|nr:RNA polymerase sigma factor [Myxococcota bacterium]